MSHIADSQVPNGIGILPLQHQGYDGQFDLPTRASLRAVRITRRDDRGEGLGHWEYDTNTPGDLVGGNFWDTDRAQRKIPSWAFAYPAMLLVGASRDVATGPGGGTRAGDASALPIGSGEQPDGRFHPKAVAIPLHEGGEEGDPRQAARQAARARQRQGQAGPGVLRLGIGGQVWPLTGGSLGFGPGFNFAPGSGVGIGQSGGFNFGGGSVGFFGGQRITMGTSVRNPGGSSNTNSTRLANPLLRGRRP